MKLLNNKGDTIVEVLLAIVVISSVLSGAYLTSRRSLGNSRQAQERGEALKYVEAQIEQIKSNPSPAISEGLTPFCYATDGSSPAGTPITDLSHCKPGTIPGGYNLSINQQATQGLFNVTATWDNALGTGKDNVKISYKINQ